MEKPQAPLQTTKRPEGVKSMLESTEVEIEQTPALEKKETPPAKDEIVEDDFSLSDVPPEKKVVETSKKEETPPKAKSKEDNMRELARLRDEAEARAKKLEEEFVKYKTEREPRIVELETLVEKTAFEKSSKFKTQYDQPVAEAETALTAFVKEYGENEEAVQQVLQLTGKERIEFLDATFNSPTASSEILRLVKTVEAKKAAKEQAIVNYKQTQEEFHQNDEIEKVKEGEKLEQNFQFVLSKLTPKVTLLREVEGDVAHNNLVAERIKTAKAIMLGTAKEEDILMAPFMAVVAKDYIRRNGELIAELNKYKKRVGEITDSTPSVRHGAIKQEGGSKKPKGMIAVMEESI